MKAAQALNGSAEYWGEFRGSQPRDRLTEAEATFIAKRDSFTMATISESGWPYVQHRGGPVGFLRVLDEKTLAFADFRGNRQYISVGNIMADDRAALIIMDYAARRRLKIYARAEIKDLSDMPELSAQLATPGYKGKIERAIILHVEAFDWNCPQHITPRFTEAELAEGFMPIKQHIAALEAENARLRARLRDLGQDEAKHATAVDGALQRSS